MCAFTGSFAWAQDIRVLKSAPAQASIGSNINYDVTISNIGASPANTVTLADPLPAGVTFVSLTQLNGPAFSCTPPPVGTNGTITCTIATLNNGASAAFEFIVHIENTVPPDTTITNTATGSAVPVDTNPGNDSASADTLAVPAGADLTVTKTGPDIAPSDSNVTYTVTISNLGPDPATLVTLNDPIPSGMTFVSATQNPPAVPLFSCSTPAVDTNGTVSCSAPSLASGQSASFTFVFHLPPSPPGTTFVNIATGSATSSDPNDENNSGIQSTSTPPPASADMSILKTGPNAAGPNTDVTYSITVSNAGPDDAGGAAWTDTLPGTMTFVSLNQNSGPAMICTTGTTVACNIATFPAGATATFTLVGHIPAGTPAGTDFQNTAKVSSNTFDPNSENDAATTLLTTSSSDLSVTKTGPASTIGGTDTSYAISIANSGPDVAQDATWTDSLPAGTTFVSLTQNTGPTELCSTPLPGTNGIVSCTIAALGSGASASFTLVINAGTATNISNTVTASSTTFDPNTGNNSSTANTTVTQQADLSVTKSGPASATAGNDITWTIAVANNGPSVATTVSLTDTLPAGTTFVSATQNTGPLFACSGTTTITCTIASLNSGATATFTFVAHINSSTTGTLNNTANISSAVADPNAGNNSSTIGTTLASSADLSITKSGPATITAGSNITYIVTASNAGPSDALNVAITDVVPANTTFVSAVQNTGPAFACSGTTTVTCTIASFAAGATATFTFTFNVSPTATGTVNNSASIASTTTDPTPANGTSASGAVVNPGPVDMSIAKTANGATFQQGSNVTYTIVVTNNGPGIAAATTVTDVLPAGTTLVSANSTQGTCSGTTTVTCSVGIMNPSTSATITLVVRLSNSVGQVSNTASVTTANTESAPANNSSTAVLDVVPPIPTLSELALALLAVMLAAAAVGAMRK